MRQENGKGVTKRTFRNMLSSQAMCFNVFAPLAEELDLATEVLQPFFDGIRRVTAVHLEYTPSDEIFRDQNGNAGVDCDVLVEVVEREGETRVITIETKFVEPGFSRCSHRKKGQCPEDVRIQSDTSNCRYVSTNEYRYWERTRQYDLLGDGALPSTGCPFGGELWQIWVNYALAHAEADRRGDSGARFAVVAPLANRKLAADEHVAAFRDLGSGTAGGVFCTAEPAAGPARTRDEVKRHRARMVASAHEKIWRSLKPSAFQEAANKFTRWSWPLLRRGQDCNIYKLGFPAFT